MNSDVIIVGAGPVGLTLAIDLASRGVSITIVERRTRDSERRVKCNHISARSMEIFRRLEVAAALRNAGLPAEHANDASFRTTMTGIEITRIPIPCRRDRYTAQDGPDTWWPTPEPPHRINQIYMEPILWDHANSLANITILANTEYVDFKQNESGVAVTARSIDADTSHTLTAQFLIGCEGGRSPIRKAIGANFVGDAVVQRVQSTYIRAPKLLEMAQYPPAWAVVNLNPRRSGTLYAIDGRETWIVHNYLRPEEQDFEAIDRDWSIRTILGVDDAFEYEVLSHEDWIGRRLVADKFRERRVFICGDSAHIWVPYAGYGMNAGIADAANLAWVLGAYLQGWAPYEILNAYERERLPITEQVSHFAMNHAHEMIKNRRRVPANIESDDAADIRTAFGQELYDLNVQQYCCGGLNFGYFYDDSPLIIYDDAKPPAYGMATFTSSTVPGCRAPHFWWADGRSFYDVLGNGYSLLYTENESAALALQEAATARGIPFAVIDGSDQNLPVAYQHAFVLIRPDQHVAWRDNALPADPIQLLDTITGQRA